MSYDHADSRPSWSRVKGVLDCPAEARWRADHPIRETPAMAMGTMMHCAILEPHELAQRYTLAPEIVRLPGWEMVGQRGAGYSCAATPGVIHPTKREAEQAARPWGWLDGPPMPAGPDGEAPGYRTQDEAAAALGAMVTGEWTDAETLSLVRERGDAARALLPAAGRLHVEVALFGLIDGVDCRGCADAIAEDGGRLLVLDVKTTGDASPRTVTRSAEWGRWHGQLATYALLALQQPRWAHYRAEDVVLGVLVVQAPIASKRRGLHADADQPRPHARLEWLDGPATAFAFAQARKAWRLWRDCDATGIWPDDVGGLEVPRWHVAEPAEEVEPW